MLTIFKRNISYCIGFNLRRNIFYSIWNFLINSDIIYIMSIYALFHLLIILSVVQGYNNPFFILADYLIK